jgi:hypothetical protein
MRAEASRGAVERMGGRADRKTRAVRSVKPVEETTLLAVKRGSVERVGPWMASVEAEASPVLAPLAAGRPLRAPALWSVP